MVPVDRSQADELMQALGTVAHELRTPLTSILGFVKTLLRTDVTFSEEEARSMLEAADRQTERLRALIENLLLASRIEAGAIQAAFAPVYIPALAHEIVAEFTRQDDTRRLELHIDDDVPELVLDGAALRWIIHNLIENACKYSPDGSSVRVACRLDGRGVLVSVSDEGPGIPPSAREQIFERFFQLDQSNTRHVGGAGLGLYICKKLAETLRAHLWVDPACETGATLHLWLPARVHNIDAESEARAVRLPEHHAS